MRKRYKHMASKKFEAWYPAYPYVVNQAWGILNPIYKRFGFDRHNGIDIEPGKDKTLYAPFSGVVVRLGDQPNGGGIFLSIMSELSGFDDGEYRVLIDLLHCEAIHVTEGQYVSLGDVLATADNTGFSTGPHTHIQSRRVKKWNNKSGAAMKWTQADTNDANGSFDMAPFWNGKYARSRPKYDGSMISLQRCLRFEGMFPTANKYAENYGPITKAAVIAFQKKYMIVPAIGNFGSITRATMKVKYG